MLDVTGQMDGWTDGRPNRRTDVVHVSSWSPVETSSTPLSFVVSISTGPSAVMLLYLALLGEGSVLSIHERIF